MFRHAALLVLGWLVCGLAQAQTHLVGKVVRVKDGDSVVLRTSDSNYEMRLGEIDAPEYDQPGGNASRQALRRLVDGQRVTATVQDIDNYGRLVVVLQRDDTNVNRRMVADGHAWAYRDYLRDAQLLELEAAARQQGIGLWAKPGAVAPWLYRRGVREATPADGELTSMWNSLSASLRSVSRNFSCGRKTYCSQMKSCSEANFYLHHCGLTRLDGDGDGKPCERLCASRRR